MLFVFLNKSRRERERAMKEVTQVGVGHKAVGDAKSGVVGSDLDSDTFFWA